MRIVEILLILILFSRIINPVEAKILAEIYKKGKVKFVEEIIITDQNLPEEAYFKLPHDLALDKNGAIYVCDVHANNIKKFDAKGEFIKVIGRKGQGPGDFVLPSIIVSAGEYIVVYESINRRLSILTLSGDLFKIIPFQLKEGAPEKIRALPNGNLVVGIFKIFFNDPKRPQEYLVELYSPELQVIKNIYKTEVRRSKWVRKETLSVEVPQLFSPDFYWDVSPEGKIIAGFSSEYKIFIIDPVKGTQNIISRGHKPVKVTDKEKEEWLERMKSGARSGDKRREEVSKIMIENTTFPEFKAVFDDILVDYEGNIWVHLYRENLEEEKTSFDVFSKDGKFINTVKITNGKYPYGAKMTKNGFWMIEQDKEGEFKIVKYRISGE